MTNKLIILLMVVGLLMGAQSTSVTNTELVHRTDELADLAVKHGKLILDLSKLANTQERQITDLQNRLARIEAGLQSTKGE